MSDEITPPSDDDLNRLRTQVDLAEQLHEVLLQNSSVINVINNRLNTQSSLLTDLNESLDDILEITESITNNFKNVTKSFKELSEFKFDQIVSNKSKEVSNVLKDVEKEVSESYSNFGKKIKSSNDLLKSATKRNQRLSEVFNDVVEAERRAIRNSQDLTNNSVKKLSMFEAFMNMIKKGLSKVLDGVKYVFDNFGKIVSFIGKVATNVLSYATNFMGSVLNSFKNLVTGFLTLPFTVAKEMSKLGGSLREIFEVQIGQTLEDLKEKFSMDSYIGKQIQSLSRAGSSAILAFKDPTSEYVKMFGYGVEGIKKYITSYAEVTESLGPWGEIYAKEIANAEMSSLFFTKIKNAAGYDAEAFKYLSLDAGINMESLSKRTYDMWMATSYVADQFKIDKKQLSKNFVTLRKDIMLFGHISDVELNSTAATMTKMGVKMEDAAAVFNKFSTFEAAANSVAILSQTFGMNLNAMDMLKAEKPEEIFSMFENAMLDTGRSFEDLSRFEKNIMAQQTGMSAESLKALMSYKKMGYTFEEAREMLEENDPTEKMLKSLDTFNDTIKEFKQIFNEGSFFDSIRKGFMTRLTYHSDTKKTLMSLSEGYEGLYRYAQKIPAGTIVKLIRPIRYIIDTMRKIFESKGFQKSIKFIIEGMGKLLETSFNITPEEVITDRVKNSLSKEVPMLNADQKDALAKFANKELNSLSSDKFDSLPESIKQIKTSQQSLTGTSSNLLDVLKALSLISKESANKVDENLKRVQGKRAETYQEKVRSATASLSSAADASKDNLGILSDLTRNVAGIVIKGALIGLTAVIKSISNQIKKIDVPGEAAPSLTELLAGIPDKEMEEMIGALGQAVGDLFSRGGKLFGLGTFIVGQMVLLFKDVTMFIGGIIVEVLRGLFGGKKELKNMTFDQASMQTMLMSEEEKSTKLSDSSNSLNKYDRMKTDRNSLEKSRGGSASAKSQDSMQKSLVDLSDRMGKTRDDLLTPFFIKLQQISQATDTKTLKAFPSTRLDELKKKYDTDRANFSVEDMRDVLEYQIPPLSQTPAAPQPTPPTAPQPTPQAAKDLLGTFDLSDTFAKSEYKFIGRDGKEIDLNSKKGALRQGDGVVSVVLNMIDSVTDDVTEIDSLTKDLYIDNNFNEKSDEDHMLRKIDELCKVIDNASKEIEKEKTLKVKTTLSNAEIRELTVQIAKLDGVLTLSDPGYGNYYLNTDSVVNRSGQRVAYIRNNSYES